MLYGRVVHAGTTHESRIRPLQSAKLDGTETLMAMLMVVKARAVGDGGGGGGSRCINPTHSRISLGDR